jgi:hypothetical protein
MASTYLQRTPSSTGNRDKWTWSAWVKRSKLGANITLFSAWADSSNNSVITFLDDDALRYYDKAAGSVQANLYTNRKFRDTNSWYHIVVVYDSGNNTSGDRVKIYVNGVEETSFSTDTMPGQNNDSTVNKASCPHYIGTDDTTGYFFDGAMSHIHFIDGTAYDASAFGETDTTTGEWKAKTSPSVNYGTNGFLILKDGNTITDQSSNSNDWTLGGGTLTDLKDNPDNVFATWNPLDNGRTWSGTIGLKNGNTTQDNASDGSPISTLGMTSGKWYAEIKIVNGVNTRSIGIIDMASANSYIGHGSIAEPISYAYNTGSQSLWSGTTEVATSVGEGVAGDIISVLVDLDSATKTIKFKKNNVDLSGTTQLTISQSDITWGFVLRCDGGQIMSANFGNGFYGTTAVSSAGTNASENGIFEYDVPTGYTALSTKGLNL